MDMHIPIVGGPRVEVDVLLRRLAARAPSLSADRRAQIASAYTAFGQLAGVGNLIPFAQGAHETAWFTSWWMVQHNNPAGLGVTGRTRPPSRRDPPTDGVWQWDEQNKNWRQGYHFDTVAAGIVAQIAHLLAYAASDGQLSPAQRLLIPFDVRLAAMGNLRGTAPRWVDLNGKWAVPGLTYGQKILEIADAVASKG